MPSKLEVEILQSGSTFLRKEMKTQPEKQARPKATGTERAEEFIFEDEENSPSANK